MHPISCMYTCKPRSTSQVSFSHSSCSILNASSRSCNSDMRRRAECLDLRCSRADCERKMAYTVYIFFSTVVTMYSCCYVGIHFAQEDIYSVLRSAKNIYIYIYIYIYTRYINILYMHKHHTRYVYYCSIHTLRTFETAVNQSFTCSSAEKLFSRSTVKAIRPRSYY